MVIFDAYPSFQIDGNFDGAVVSEMLVQSDVNEIRLRHALPDVWKSGSVKGIYARGSFEVSLDWSNKTLKKQTISSKKGKKLH